MVNGKYSNKEQCQLIGWTQLINAPGEKKWVEVKVLVGTKAEFLAEGRDVGFKTTWTANYSGINLRIIFSDNTRWIFP